jgi:hypothetical protein
MLSVRSISDDEFLSCEHPFTEFRTFDVLRQFYSYYTNELMSLWNTLIQYLFVSLPKHLTRLLDDDIGILSSWTNDHISVVKGVCFVGTHLIHNIYVIFSVVNNLIIILLQRHYHCSKYLRGRCVGVSFQDIGLSISTIRSELSFYVFH